jgi:GWxTD domain-containing protein
MNALESWVRTPLAEALGWTLVHFVWEGAAIAALLALALAFCRPAAARLRYALGCLALLAMPVAFAVTLALWVPSAADRIPPYWAGAPAGLLSAAQPAPLTPAPGPGAYLAWLAPLWAAGVLCLYVYRLGGWFAARRLLRRGTQPPPMNWLARLPELARRAGVARGVVLLESCLAEVPMAIGWLRPAILFPVGMLAGLPPSHVEAILLHELAHIRRADYLVNLLETATESLLFYHPAVWWISRVIRAERENCCDDLAVALQGDAGGYAAALLALERSRSSREPALAATGGTLRKRVERLLRRPDAPRSAAAPAALAAAGVFMAALLMAAPQPAPAPQSSGQQPLTPESKAAMRAKLESELATPYRKWLEEDVAYIITDQERAAFKALQTDEEREHFIEQFWLRRDPTPGTTENEFKEEHYRRIAYANQHFSEGIPGWKTDRGRIYIMYGPPDEIEDHRSPAPGDKPSFKWRYRHIEGIGDNVVVEFVDWNNSGQFRMTRDPDAPVKVDIVQSDPNSGKVARVEIPCGKPVTVYGRVLTPSGTVVRVFQGFVSTPGTYVKEIPLAPGSYRVIIATQDPKTGAANVSEKDLKVY